MDNMENQAAPEEVVTNNDQKSTGSVVGAVIVVVILILGGFYFWGQKLDTPTEETAGEATTEEVVVGEDAALADIEADLEAMNTENLDAELNAIDEELAQ